VSSTASGSPRGKAIYQPGRDLDYIDVTLTGLHYDTGAALQEGRPDEGASLRGEQVRGDQ
jgi:hypothetical protein